jgi:hypothetical protein
MSQAASDITPRRIPEIDFWRGFALVVILVDHIPWNGLDYLTPQNFGFSDAAEAFVFLSGASVSLAYASTLQKAGFRRVVERCATRAGKLYLVQIAIVACSVAIPLAAAAMVGDQNVALWQGASRFVASPVSALVGVLTLTYQPNLSNVLALYVVLMLWAPVVIFLASRSSALALTASMAVYLAGRGRLGVEGDGWYFNPFAWQLVFALGIICALRWRNGLPRPQRPLVMLALAIILGGAILSIKAMGFRAAALAHLDLDKHNLGLVRVAHFVALAYVLSILASVQPWATTMGRIVCSRTGQSLQGMGRKSLLFFTLGSVASVVGRCTMTSAQFLAAPHLSVRAIGLVFTATAVAGMFLIANRMDRTANQPGRSIENRNMAAIPMNSLPS